MTQPKEPKFPPRVWIYESGLDYMMGNEERIANCYQYPSDSHMQEEYLSLSEHLSTQARAVPENSNEAWKVARHWQAECDRAEAQLTKAEAERDSFRKELKEVHAAYDEQFQKMRNLEAQLTKAKAEIADLNQRITLGQRLSPYIEKEREHLIAQLTKAKAENKKLTEALTINLCQEDIFERIEKANTEELHHVKMEKDKS
jgi:septal ring factor EnvC (AmiA/AmiB activator)